MSEPNAPFELRIVSPPKETPPPKGFQVKITNQNRIYRSIPAVVRREPPSALIQYNDIGDNVCGNVSTVMRCYDHKSTYNPSTYEFDGEVDFEGKKFDALSLKRGYFTESQVKRIAAALETIGYKGDYEEHVTIVNNDNLRSLRIRDQAGRQYTIRMGFTSPKAHREWIDKQVAWEKEEVAPDYYTNFEQQLKSNLHNDNIKFYSQPFKYAEDLGDADYFAFSQNLVGFARAYEDFLNALYACVPATPPDKTLMIKPN